MLRIAMLCAAAALSQGARAAASPCPDQVRVSLPNFEIAPYVLGTDTVAEPPGLLIEWTRHALKRAGCAPRIVIVRRPPNRQLAELAGGTIDVLPGFAFSQNSTAGLAFPMKNGAVNRALATMTDSVSLYARADDTPVSWNGATLRSPNPLVGSSTGGASTKGVAKAHGWSIEYAPTPQANVRKLIAGRVDVILEPDVVVLPYLAGLDGHAVRRLQPPVQLTHRYAPVSKVFMQAYPEFTERFWREMCRQAHAGAAARTCE